MDTYDLFLSSRRGDLSRVKYLVEQKEVDTNVRDKWDSTPLYYACLCGHIDVVHYLLSNGARCEANTFDGERCLYGALNNEIRKLLLNFKIITTQSMRRDVFEEFLRRLLSSGEYSDATFIVHGEEFNVHKCILSARCDYFCDLFQTKWKNRRAIHISNDLVRPAAFQAVLQYLYTGRTETHIDMVEDCIRLAVQCKLHYLKQQLEEMVKKITSFECTKPGTNVTTLLIEAPESVSEVQQDFGVMAEQALPVELCNWVVGSELPHMPSVPPCFVDLCIVVEGLRFLCHKVFLCGRSEYFKVLVQDHFCETAMDESRALPVITLHDIRAGVFSRVLYYCYTNTAQLSEDIAYDVLCAADMYLLVGLKRLCGNYLAELLDLENIIMLLRTARLFDLARLEDQCTEFIAKHIDKMVENEEFRQIILDDVKEVHERQETDTIPIVDDVRYHITSGVQTFSEMSDANDKLMLIDSMLEELGLDA